MSCCGMCGSHSDYEDNNDDIEAQAERRPLLAADEATDRQRVLHAKLHTYQMARALADGYLPSTEQAAAQIARGAAAVSNILLHARTVRQGRLSARGRHLLQLVETWLEQLLRLLENKNGRDQIQEFVWWARGVSRGRGAASMAGVQAVVQEAGRSLESASASASAGWTSLQAIGSLLLESTPFKMLLADLADIGRDVFKDTAAATAEAANTAARNVDGTGGAGSLNPAMSGQQPPPASETLTEIADEIAAGASKVAAEAQDSIGAKLGDDNNNSDGGGARERLASRLRAVVASLSQKPDYAQSVSMLTTVLQRGASVYLKSVAAAADNVAAAADAVVQEQVQDSSSTQQDQVLRDFWTFLTAFGDAREWHALEETLQRVLDKVGGSIEGQDKQKERDANIDGFVQYAGETIEQALTDPSFYSDDVLAALQKRLGQFSMPSASHSAVAVDGLDEDLDALVRQAKTTLDSAMGDADVHGLIDVSLRLLDVLWPTSGASYSYATTDLASDAAAVFVPALLQAVRYVPVPRVEVLAPDMDLLLESLVLEPATARDSLLPNHVRVQLRNNVDIFPPQAASSAITTSTSNETSALQTSVAITVQGLSLQAQDVGYVLRLHAGLLRLLDRGIGSLRVSGVDVALDMDIVRDRAERVLALRRVDVSIAQLDYRLTKSSLSCLAWLLRPILRPMLRKTLQTHLATAIQELFAAANTELVFARERLRGARAAGAGGGLQSLQSLPGLARALLARFQEPVPTDTTQVSVGVAPSSDSPFAGVYAPGSLVRVWRDEAEAAADRVEDGAARGWRNAIFDRTCA